MHPAFNRSSQKPPQGVNAPLDDRGRTALHLAVEKNDEVAVQRLLRIGANINQLDKQGQTPLFEAAAKGHQNMLELLTARGAKIDHRDQQGRSIADWAIENGADAIFLDILASYGAPFEAAQKTRRTPLHRAAEQGRADLIETLVLQGLDLNARDSEGKTPLHLATSNGHLDAMRRLIVTTTLSRRCISPPKKATCPRWISCWRCPKCASALTSMPPIRPALPP